MLNNGGYWTWVLKYLGYGTWTHQRLNATTETILLWL